MNRVLHVTTGHTLVHADVSGTEHKAVICEGTSNELACPDGQSLAVTSALWGRSDAQRCSRGDDDVSGHLPYKNVTDTLRQLCDNRSRCDVTADVTVLGELRSQGSTTPSLYLLANYSCKSICFLLVVFVISTVRGSDESIVYRVNTMTHEPLNLAR